MNRPRRPRELLPSTKAVRLSGRETYSMVVASTNWPGRRMYVSVFMVLYLTSSFKVMTPVDKSSTILKVFPRRISTLAGCTCSLSNGVIDKVPASSILNSVLSDKIIVSPSHIKRYYILSHNPCAGNINLPIIILRLP